MEERDLTVAQVAQFAECHINTVKNYEQKGHIVSMRDVNNVRRFPMSEAVKLREILQIRKRL